MTQSEAQLEADLVAQLADQGYEVVTLPDEAAMLDNLRIQLGLQNDTAFSDAEFARIIAHLDGGDVFERAHRLRDRFDLARDDGTSTHIQFLNGAEWCHNRFQVARQITQEGRRVNRYDVTILINGLPLVQIELKRRGAELAEAFNQINRYHRDSYHGGAGLFLYVQIFVISNGVNSVYFANQRHQSAMQTYPWAGPDNAPVSQLSAFTATFLQKCHVARMICRHTVLHKGDRVLMVLRPYQVHAVEAIVERVRETRSHGYIWHTTGSGKTLTSFKAAQIISSMPDVEKVLFVVDRADLDYQTMQEFNAFQPDAVDGSSNTAELVRHFGDPNRRLVVTTIQKLARAITHRRHEAVMQDFRDRRVVLIFDECHRSQFGQTHRALTNHFRGAQMFGFTGTPIFEVNAINAPTGAGGVRKRTTEQLFDKCLHRYIITNAIADRNVLPFSIEYWGRLKRRDGSLIDDEQVAGINRREFFEDEDRVYKIVDWIIANHNRKTHDRAFTAILAVGSIDVLIKYYDRFRALWLEGKHDLKIAAIFSAPANEDDPLADGHLPPEEPEAIEPAPENTPARRRLDDYIADYNALYGASFDTRNQGGFYKYYRDISRRIKLHDRQDFKVADRVDILLVVSMFLTGFDAKKLNTIYVDKTLRHHGLIQTFSRTNRIFDRRKSHGNVVAFRNLRNATKEALHLYADEGAGGTIMLGPYDEHVARFNEETVAMLAIAPTVASVDRLIDEESQLAFIRAFRAMMRTMNTLKGFAEFRWSHLEIPEQTYEDYKSKYLDLHDAVRQRRQGDAPASILQEVDFELELIRRDEINVSYILRLLADAPRSGNEADRTKRSTIRSTILTLLETEPQLRSKRELIEEFIRDYWDEMRPGTDIEASFDYFWDRKRDNHITALCDAEELQRDGVERLIAQYRFSGREPVGDEVIGTMLATPGILERRRRITSATNRIMNMIEIFEDA